MPPFGLNLQTRPKPTPVLRCPGTARHQSFTHLSGRLVLMASAAEMKKFVSESAESELRFIWQDKEVNLEAQYHMCKARLTTISRFSEIEDDKEAFKKTIAEICRLDPHYHRTQDHDVRYHIVLEGCASLGAG